MKVRIWAHLNELKKRMMKKSSFLIFVSFLLFINIKVHAQNKESAQYAVLFYNVENLFDVSDDPATEDEAFTPEGDRHWTFQRLNRKVLKLSKVILNASGWHPPDIIAFCEVENRNVLNLLLSETPLNTFSYEIIHKESPDERGIDVAFLYNPSVFYPME